MRDKILLRQLQALPLDAKVLMTQNRIRERERELEEYDDPFNGIHNPTVYSSRAEMKAIESESDLD